MIHVILAGNERSVAVAERIGSTLIGPQQGLPGVTDQEVLIFGQQAPGGSG